MDLLQLLASLLTPEFISELLSKFKKGHTVKYPIRDLIYGKGVQHPFASISLADLQRQLSNIPVVRRGTEAYAIDSAKGTVVKVEPQGIEMSDFISAADINDLSVIFAQHGEKAIKSYLESRINDMLIITQKSIEALAAQSLTGNIDYPMKGDAGAEIYGVEFGETLTYIQTTKLTKDSLVADLYLYLSKMHETMQEKEYGDDVVTLAGSNAYALALGIVTASKQNTITVQLGALGEINVGGYVIVQQSGKYKGVNGAMTDKINADSFCMIDKNANHKLYFLALDDIDAGNKPLPFFATHEVKKNPSGVDIIGRSKPLPAPIVHAIIWSTVVTVAK
jgi:hypothetical protein